MINKIDWLANRVLFSIFDLATPLYCLISWFVYRAIWRPYNSIPFIQKRIKKSFGEDYDSLVKWYEDWSPYKSPEAFYRVYWQEHKISTWFLFLPISLFLNVVTLIVGNPLRRLYNIEVGLMFLAVLIVLLSSWLGEFLFWKKDRHYEYVKIFLKENFIKRLVWIIGTLVALVLLTVIDFRLLGYIIGAN